MPGATAAGQTRRRPAPRRSAFQAPAASSPTHAVATCDGPSGRSHAYAAQKPTNAAAAFVGFWAAYAWDLPLGPSQVATACVGLLAAGAWNALRRGAGRRRV